MSEDPNNAPAASDATSAATPSAATAPGATSAAAPLTFDAWARLSAQVTARGAPPRGDILAAARVEESRFTAADERFRAALDADLAAGRTRRAERYSALCAAEADRSRRAAIDATRRARPAPVVITEVPDGRAATLQVPSFLLEKSAAEGAAAGRSAPAAAPAFTPPAVVSLVGPPTVPLAPGPASAPRQGEAGSTLDLTDVSHLLEDKPALPFQAGPPGATLPEPLQMPSRSRAGFTADVSDVSSELDEEPLPFKSGPPPSGNAAPPDSSTRPPSTKSPAEELVGGLSLRQYASLCAELSVYPTYASSVLQRYGLTPASRAQVEAAWSARLRADPALDKTFRETFTSYGSWLRTRR